MKKKMRIAVCIAVPAAVLAVWVCYHRRRDRW